MDSPTYQELENQITELQKKNEILRLHSSTQKEEEREYYSSNTLNYISDPVFIKDDQSRLLIVNDAFCKLFGLSRVDIIGKTLAEDVSPEERESFLKIDKEVIADGVKNINEESLTVRGGETRTISTQKTRFIDSEGKKFLIGIIRDITERKEAELALIDSELRWKFAIEGNSDGLWDWNLITNEVFFSAQWEKMLGFTEGDISGNLKEWDKRIHPDDKKKVYEDINKYLNGETDFYENEHRLLCKNNTYKWILDRGKIISYTSDNEPERMIGTHSYISKRKKVEQALKESETQLKELNTAKDKLYSIIAHDLRSPFNSVLGFSDLLINSQSPLDLEKTIKYSTHINTTAKSTLILLDNLLIWEKSQTGKINFSPEKLILSTVISEIIDISNSNAVIKRISLNFNSSDDTEVFTDINMLKTVLRNLISNAIKFTNSNGKIDIHTIQKQNMVEITISDNGTGMSRDKCNNLFNIGTDTIARGTAGEKGSGLGLLVCKEFVEKQGGKIWVESELGEGSDFKFTLPLKPIN